MYIALFLLVLPITFYLLWRRFGPADGQPSKRMLFGLTLLLLLLGSVATWVGLTRGAEHGATYIPAQLGPDGRIIPGRWEAPR